VNVRRKLCLRAAIGWVAAALLIPAASHAQSNSPAFVAPPRTIADITAILDQGKPDPKVAAKLRADAGANAPAGADRAKLARFYYDRSHAHAELGEHREALEDARNAVELARGSLKLEEQGGIKQQVALQHSAMGDPKKALEILRTIVREYNQPSRRGRLINTYRLMIMQYITLGDFRQADATLRNAQALIQNLRNSPNHHGFLRATWECDAEYARALLFDARGQFHEAELAYRRAEALRRESIRERDTYAYPPPVPQMEQAADLLVAYQGRVKARQGRIAEGEADVRRALLSRLRATSKYNLTTARYVGFLANALVEQGRFTEAEKLVRSQIEIYRGLGVSDDTQSVAMTLSQLGSILNLQEHWQEAAQVYRELDKAISSWQPQRRDAALLNTEYIATLYRTNNVSSGIAAAERLLARNAAQLGEQHVETALARGLLGIGYAHMRRDAEALGQFKQAIPILMARSRETDDDDPAITVAREQRTQIVVESYIALLAHMASAPQVGAAVESFRLADNIRSRSVQRALAASSARATASNPALADLARKTQDMERQIGAQLGLLNSVLALPPEERDEKTVKSLQADIDTMRKARDAARRDLTARFPQYSSLLESVPPSVDDIKAVLRADEAFVSFYFGRDNSFVWAFTKGGPIAFAAIGETADEIDKKVHVLRGALEPNATMISDIPPFDVALAHELYMLLLRPVEAGWKPAKNLIVATNGALGLLPLGLLPTAPAAIKVETHVDLPSQIAARGLRRESSVEHFAGYRNVAWLARTHAVTLMPSASALRTLRQLSIGSDKRQPMIGFGDPLFNQKQAVEAQVAMDATTHEADVTRGVELKRRAAPQTRGIDSAQLGLLPRLPDTADELKSIALALQADPSKVLNLGKAANEETVKKTDLSKYRIIVFATHGLVSGDLDGLHQPALAMTAPEVAGVPGDGLLTMEEILALKLDADWVVLSACNTGAGAGAESEAGSGLGRAFFYAGTRAILVTNWSVHSDSARQLVSEMFARQTADPSLSRGEALRQAMMALLDGPGFTDAHGKTLFAYDHPLSWAPYTIIGDGG
jgi:CHAT domain-containing protein